MAIDLKAKNLTAFAFLAVLTLGIICPYVLAEESTTFPSEVDIINPEPGQFANYYAESDGSYGWWNTSYNEYVQAHVINTTHASGSSYMGYDAYWCTVDKRNRLVTDGNYTYWNQT